MFMVPFLQAKDCSSFCFWCLLQVGEYGAEACTKNFPFVLWLSLPCQKQGLLPRCWDRGHQIYLLFIYLAVLRLNCGMWDLPCIMRDLSLQHTGSLAVAHGLQGVWAQ